MEYKISMLVDTCQQYKLASLTHFRRQFIAGTCGRTNCKFGHDLHNTHNNSVLSRHRVTRMRDSEIIELLRQKENPDGLQVRTDVG